MNTAHRILLISRLNEEAVALKQKLARNKLYDVHLTTTAPRAIGEITGNTPNLVVFNMDLFTRDKIQLATDFRNLGYDFATLVLARTIARDAYSTVSSMGRAVLLETPYEDKDFYGLTEKLVQGIEVKQRIHRRFYTNQPTEIETLSGRGNWRGHIRNLSRGGAFIEFGGSRVRDGELLKLDVELSEIARNYKVNAKVVWTTHESPWGAGAGVEFMRASDVYRNLLQKI